MIWQLCTGLEKNVVAGTGQVVQSNLFLLGHNSFLARQLQIFIVTYLYKTKFLIHQKGKGLDKVSGHPRIWRDKAYFWPDIVCWPAVISSPGVVFNFRAKVSCIMSVDGIKLWLLTWLVNWSVNWHCYWLSVSYTVSVDVIGDVDYKNKYTMNSKRKENDDHYKVSESIVADGIVG